ncbi:RelA/SpoT domain-containing protein [Flavobacterium azooxidireducens]|uniref:RelA/SpoT domain-containing protein n=1 Tax=Flavobacterium azooxidireducens TaxID=1871076 RepID=A0ABY4KFP1_9FLAO|nr:RelA/SpoT domain-containing protein [Flavobacterium azooxidireducens]UPQ78205.1 RelA/SpoT domain-containing protein [Flavobacterium azooxidireducens]
MVSNTRINKIGENIAARGGEITPEELEQLQLFRTSFSKPLVDVFNITREIADKVHQSSILAFRLKRIDTIINKLSREKEMDLSRMGDIGGIRCIFYNEAEVYKAKELIEKTFESGGKTRDYIKEIHRDIGYKSIHMYVKDPVSQKRIEIQLRTRNHHNWATLIEITDLLYDLRLKELGFESNKKFGQFHALMSSDKELTKEEAELIYEVLDKYNFITVLSDTFRKNNAEVKKRWSDENKKNSFFLIEASKTQIPNLKSFRTFEEAEHAYFEKYKENSSAEIVLTSIKKPNFKQISVAYANYILSYHTFMSDIRPILQVLAIEALEDKNINKFEKIFKTYEDLIANLILEVISETADLFFNRMDKNKIIIIGRTNKMNKLQEREIIKKIDLKIREFQRTHHEFILEIEENIPKGYFKKKKVEKFLKKHNERIANIIMSKEIKFENLI